MGAIGVNYGLKGGNLPPPKKVISLYQSRNIKKLRLFNPDATVLAALQNSGIEVVLGTLDSDLEPLSKYSTGTSYAEKWVRTNVLPYAKTVRFRYITAGNEVIPGEDGKYMKYVLRAMTNLDLALRAVHLSIPVSTAVASNVLKASYPPSKGAFSELAVMTPIAAFLKAKKAPLLVNVYPYKAYHDTPTDIPLEFALLSPKSKVENDGTLRYTNLFDMMVDSVYAALEKVNASEVKVVVSETGWPSAGHTAATLENAKTYNQNLINHVACKEGTPRRPGKGVETYLFAMFNENQKPGVATEQHFGLYHPDMTEVYHVNFRS